nr:FCD domain-containing protein [Asticcacaulis aquaticus]
MKIAPENLLPFKDSEIGTFKLLEARRLIEGEVCALAAVNITPSELDHLERLLGQMTDPDRDIAERADREFHITIAQASDNEAIKAMVEMLWDWRYHSASARQLMVDIADNGMTHRVIEHGAIVDALKSGSGAAARQAMRDHLDRVVTHLLEAVEDAAVQQVRAANSRRRQHFTHRAKGVDV